MKFLVFLFMAGAILVASDHEVVIMNATINLWKEGKVPYEISKQYSKLYIYYYCLG